MNIIIRKDLFEYSDNSNICPNTGAFHCSTHSQCMLIRYWPSSTSLIL